MPDYKNMTIEQLERANQELMKRRQRIKGEQKQIAAELDSRQAEISARKKVSSMSDSEKAAAAQILKTEGIESAEAVGSPGAS